MPVLDGFLDAQRRRGVAVLATLESRRALLSDSVSALVRSDSARQKSPATGLQATGSAWLAYID